MLSTLGGGGLFGVCATVAMSGVLAAAVHGGVLRSSPPKQITRKLFPGLGPIGLMAATVAGHTLYGAGAGAAFGILVPSGRATPVAGMVYGLALWAGGYEGWVPALGLLPPAHRDTRRRAATMMAAHLIYGATLGAFTR